MIYSSLCNIIFIITIYIFNSFVRVRNHNKNTVPLFESEKFTMFLLETGRLSIKPPVEMCTIVFDMTDFSMNNMVK